MNVKLLLDTDIGSDVDDAWALSLCLASNDIELDGITLVHADLETRAKITLKLLNLARRLNVPVFKGLSNPLTEGAHLHWGTHEGSETDFSDIACMQAKDNAVDFILDSARKYSGELVVCSVGPMTNIGEAIRRDPETMRKVKRLAIMAGKYAGEGLECAAPEHNACVDPVATKLVFELGIPTTLVGVNVTRQVTICREDVRPLEGWAYGDYLAALTHQYLDVTNREATYMHDPLAVATVIDPSLVETKSMNAQVLDDGRIVWTPGGHIDVCIGVDAPRFTKLLLDSVYSLRKHGDTQCR